MKLTQTCGTFAAGLLLSSCVSFETASSRLGSLATTTSTAENQNLRQSVAYACRSQAFAAASNSVVAAVAAKSKYAVILTCQPIASDLLLAQHEAAIKAVVAYASALQQLVTLGSNSPLDPATKDLGTQLTAAAKTTPLSSLGPGSDIVSAITEVADFVLKGESKADARAAAKKMQPHLAVLVNILKAEHKSLDQVNAQSNIAFRSAISGFQDYVSGSPATAMLQTWTAYDTAGLLPGSPYAVQFAKSSDLDIALDALLKCNAAIASDSKHPEADCTEVSTLAIGQSTAQSTGGKAP